MQSDEVVWQVGLKTDKTIDIYINLQLQDYQPWAL